VTIKTAKIIPEKLKVGDEVRVIAPARSLSMINEETRQIAITNLELMGLTVTYSKNCEESDDFVSSSIESRIEDLHDAFRDPNVKGILTVIGGHNCNQLLDEIDFELIKNNPKILCGYSDITALSNAIYAKTGLVTYSGPHYSTFGMKKGLEYTLDYFKKSLFEIFAFEVCESEKWSDEAWFLDQDNRTFEKNEGIKVFSPGEASGTIVGGNLCTLNLLHGTEYMPSISGSILFVEDDVLSSPETFDRDLQSLIHQPGFDQVKGLVIGRFQKDMKMTDDLLKKILKSKKKLSNMPIIYGVDFGHTTPLITYPIGGEAILKVTDDKVKLILDVH